MDPVRGIARRWTRRRRVVALAALAVGTAVLGACGGGGADDAAFTPVAGSNSAYCATYRAWKVYELDNGEAFDQPTPAALHAWWKAYLLSEEAMLRQAPQEIHAAVDAKVRFIRTRLTPLVEKYEFDLERMRRDGTAADQATMFESPPAEVQERPRPPSTRSRKRPAGPSPRRPPRTSSSRPTPRRSASALHWTRSTASSTGSRPRASLQTRCKRSSPATASGSFSTASKPRLPPRSPPTSRPTPTGSVVAGTTSSRGTATTSGGSTSMPRRRISPSSTARTPTFSSTRRGPRPTKCRPAKAEAVLLQISAIVSTSTAMPGLRGTRAASSSASSRSAQSTM
jgi:hypothetical protein